MAKRQSTSDKLKGNKNALKWTLKGAEEMFIKAIDLSKEKKDKQYTYDFIGEIARELDSFKEIFSYLIKQYPELKELHNKLISNCEANCYYNGKNSFIVPSLSIMNLKSNHKWTDRQDNTTDGEQIAPIVVNLGDGAKPREG